MILLFSKQDISNKVGIDPDESGEYLRLKLSVAGVETSAKRFNPKSVLDVLWDESFKQTKSRTKADIMFDTWATSFKEMGIKAFITDKGNDIIQVELL